MMDHYVKHNSVMFRKTNAHHVCFLGKLMIPCLMLFASISIINIWLESFLLFYFGLIVSLSILALGITIFSIRAVTPRMGFLSLLHYLHAQDRYKFKPNDSVALRMPDDTYNFFLNMMALQKWNRCEKYYPQDFTLMYFLSSNEGIQQNTKIGLFGYCVIVNKNKKPMFCYLHSILGYELICELPKPFAKPWIEKFFIDHISDNYDTVSIV